MAAIEIAGDPPLETLRLADVNHLAAAVEIHIDARALREREYLLAQLRPGAVVADVGGGSVLLYFKTETSLFIDVSAVIGESLPYLIGDFCQ